MTISVSFQPFDSALGRESFGFAQDREPVENPELVEVVERLF